MFELTFNIPIFHLIAVQDAKREKIVVYICRDKKNCYSVTIDNTKDFRV